MPFLVNPFPFSLLITHGFFSVNYQKGRVKTTWLFSFFSNALRYSTKPSLHLLLSLCLLGLLYKACPVAGRLLHNTSSAAPAILLPLKQRGFSKWENLGDSVTHFLQVNSGSRSSSSQRVSVSIHVDSGLGLWVTVLFPSPPPSAHWALLFCSLPPHTRTTRPGWGEYC